MWKLLIFSVCRLSFISLKHLKVLCFVFTTYALSKSPHKEILRIYRFFICISVTCVDIRVIRHIMIWALLFDKRFYGDNIKKWVLLYRRINLGQILLLLTIEKRLRSRLLPIAYIVLTTSAFFNWSTDTSCLEISHGILLLLKHIFLYLFLYKNLYYA